MPAAKGGAAGYWHLWRANKKAYRTKKIMLLLKNNVITITMSHPPNHEDIFIICLQPQSRSTCLTLSSLNLS